MKIFLAGQHTYPDLIAEICGGGTGADFISRKPSRTIIDKYIVKHGDMIIYLAGGISGNLKPAWKRMVDGEDISDIGFIKALQDENFWQGGSLGTGYKTRLRQ